jgi:hypothetical protein
MLVVKIAEDLLTGVNAYYISGEPLATRQRE